MEIQNEENKSWVIILIFFLFLVLAVLLTKTHSISSSGLILKSNLIKNGDFESPDIGKIANWEITDLDLNKWYLVQKLPGTQYVDYVIEKNNNLELKPNHVLHSTDYLNCHYYCSASAVQIIPALEKKNYFLSVDAKILDIAANSEGQSFGSLYLDFLNKDFKRISVKTIDINLINKWQDISVSGISPIGTKYIRVILYTGDAQLGQIMWDNVKLIKK